METTNVFKNNLAAFIRPDVRTIVNKGGARSSKTWSILQLLYIIAVKSKKPRTISVVSESLPHLKRGCIRDFENILKADSLWNESLWNATDKIYRVNNCEIEFFGADTPGKVMGPARDILFINECINVPFDVYRQLATRTREKVIIDYNPLYEFWVDDKVLPADDSELIHSTYKDNDMLAAAQIGEIEYQGSIDENYYRVYILGETGSYEGLVIKNWDIVGDMVKDFKKEYIGLDFGYGAPTAAEHIRLSGGETWIDEIIYETNLTNPDIAKRIKDAGLGHVTVVADSAEPKSIRELQNAGLTVVPADKGDDSVRLGIQIMNRYKKHYTARSLGSIDENRKYRYMQDSNGNYTGKPIDKFNHAKDAERYVFLKYLGDIITEFDFSVIRA
jgi:phage terminase large subunit